MTVNTDWVAIHSSLVESTWYVMKKSHYSDTQFSSKYTALVCQTKHVNPTLQPITYNRITEVGPINVNSDLINYWFLFS